MTEAQEQAAPGGWNAESKYRTLFDSIDEGFCVVEVLFDRHGRPHDYVFLETNPSFERQTGLVQAAGRSMRSLAPAHEEHWFRTYGAVASSGTPVRFEAPAAALGRWYDVYAFRVGEPGQNLVAILFNDIAQRKALEQHLARSSEALREADARKDRFLATLSHELRNPLAPLRIAADLLGRDDLAPGQIAQARDVVQRQVGVMARLLDDLLDVARITQGKMRMAMQPARLGAVIDTAIEAVRPLLDRKQHVLEVTLDGGDPVMDMDPVRISQVLSNLLTNAAKYTDPGGRIALLAQVRDGEARIEVQDNGIGMAPGQLPLLFAMFSQHEEGAERSEGGLGIGLALVKGIVEMHGGSVFASSAGLGQGSRFTVRLPLRPAADPALPAVPARACTPRRILVADDNRDAADMLGMLLEQLGHEVRLAYDGQAAVAVARAFQPDMAVLDLGMPQMDGFAVAAALRQEPWAPQLVLVAATGWGDSESRRQSGHAGFDHHLTKPIDAGELMSLLAAPAGAAR